jgi:hypothetical protein
MSKYSRKDYARCAALISNLDVLARDANIQKYIEIFSRDNPRFSRDKFVDACVPPVIEVTAAGKRELLSGGR